MSDLEEVQPELVVMAIGSLFLLDDSGREMELEAEKLIPSIIKDGVPQLCVHKVGKKYVPISPEDEQRYLAAKKIDENLGSIPTFRERFRVMDTLSSIPCVVHEGISEYEHALDSRVNLILNRKTPPLEKARAAGALIRYSGSLTEASREFGIPKTTLSQLNRLNDHLDSRVQEMVSDNGTSANLPLALLIELSRLTMEKQYEVAQKIVSENLRTEQARRIIRAERGKSASSLPLRVPVLPVVFSALESVAEQNETTLDCIVQAILILSLQRYGHLSSEIEVTDSDGKRLLKVEQILGAGKTRKNGGHSE